MTASSEPDGAAADRPVLRIIAGNPSPAEIAAVTVVLTVLSGGTPEAAPAPTGGWSDLSLRLRRPLPPGPGAWRNSAFQ